MRITQKQLEKSGIPGEGQGHRHLKDHVFKDDAAGMPISTAQEHLSEMKRRFQR
ncbi:hypothetical protein ACFO4N_05170 [Camelliibacillus cellulosilyticus]|uniref:YpzG-like protein n=1 Tax=Camelliibacillus cellulosilyticus TaxID=2174486 RepID=A0ABV9GJN0_9BACL